MKSIPLTQGQFALVDDEDYERVSQYKWYLHHGSYAATTLGHRGSTMLLHRFIMGVTDRHIQVDHCDMNGLNNCRSNLRTATHQQNQRNRKKYSRNTTGYKGVFRNPKTRRWRAMITVNGKCVHIGYFDDIIDAAKAYDAAARIHHGAFARTNF